MTKESDRWEARANTEPYFTVLSDPRFLIDRINEDARREFFKSGEAYVDSLLRLRREEIRGANVVQRVLELGCGPGRLAIAFAQRGLAVTAVDISPTMLSIAAGNAEALNVRNIEFLRLDRFIGTSDEFDLINVHFVLQHLQPKVGLGVLEQLLPRLARHGTIHIHVPLMTSRSKVSRLLTIVRGRLPGMNAIANVVRARPAHAPLLPPHVYSANDILSLLSRAGVEPRVIRVSVENELEVAVISALRMGTRLREAARNRGRAAASPEAGDSRDEASDAGTADLIHVEQIIRDTSIEELNRRAEQYFAGMTSWDAQLAKPFANASDASAMLTSLAVLLKGMRLVRGLTVLDFGAGTGWLGRALTQLGCRVILLDVSQTALEIAEEHFRRVPVVGDHIAPQFLHYDGHTINLPDQSLDRVICFDAFHHAPNPDDVLREFGRLLRPGGIAAFGEPGPEHSRSPQSQFEMRAYGVVENDIDIHRIWSLARTIGFEGMRVAAFSGTPQFLRADEFEDFMDGGSVVYEFVDEVRTYLTNARTFFLDKAGSVTANSWTASALACHVEVRVQEAPVAGSPIRAEATIHNVGLANWLSSEAETGGVNLGCHLYADGVLADLNYHWQPIPTENGLPPGQSTTFEFQLPPLPAGSFDLEFDCVARGVAWFAQVGTTGSTRVNVIVAENRER